MSSLITSFADIESKEIQWLWNPYIALEKLTLAYGTKEADLTDFMLRFTAALSVREPWPRSWYANIADRGSLSTTMKRA